MAPRTTAGLLLTVLGSLAFVVQADAAVEGDGLAAFDPQLTTNFVAHRTDVLSFFARAITFVGQVPVLTVLTVIAAGLIRLRTHRWRPAVVLAAGMTGAAILTYALKVLIGRHRPDASIVLGTVSNGFSFPSGHSLSGTVFFLLLAALLWYTGVSRALKIAGTAVAVVLSVAMGLSRVYLGYHWATDVLAGWTVAVTWLCLLATLVHLLSGWRADPSDTRGREASTP
ncbi:undecaprenyl-diphosphatase [Kribbella aluminosa]|uniref:Undecaprenyl-diphosphatase n=1 Tax=Kribbella aluminosa TaxID=416017 RepID=A0ABS4UW06_9ACTN|nr:phosphatase PAP2 family protein [Kribbella aluminosa]MBP2355840.1 undecaprenyl-diphosphatase [Kribbella aluminosa]